MMGRIAVRVEKIEAEDAIGRLRVGGYLDEERRIRMRGALVEIPVVSAPLQGGWEMIEQRRPSFKRPRLNHELIKKTLGVEGRVAQALRHYELLGEVLIVSLPNNAENKHDIGRGLMGLIPRAKAVLNYGGISGVFREPKVELIAGEAKETLHRENGCVFKMDPLRVMFSSGNHEERKRMATISNPGEVVLDMFAGVGQFTIPLAKYSRPKKLYAVEKNPVAHHYLSENVRLNGLANVETIHGDCREVSPKGIADRVIMGYFNSGGFIPTALKALRGRGIIHHHFLAKRGMVSEEAKRIAGEIEKLGYSAGILKIEDIKSYAPSVHHCVLDVEVAPLKI